MINNKNLDSSKINLIFFSFRIWDMSDKKLTKYLRINHTRADWKTPDGYVKKPDNALSFVFFCLGWKSKFLFAI